MCDPSVNDMCSYSSGAVVMIYRYVLTYLVDVRNIAAFMILFIGITQSKHTHTHHMHARSGLDGLITKICKVRVITKAEIGKNEFSASVLLFLFHFGLVSEDYCARAQHFTLSIYLSIITLLLL